MVYGEPIEINDIDLNNEWVSDTEDDDYSYFKSNSNVGIDNSFSQCKVTWSNLTSITFKYMSSSEIKYDYLCVGKLDGEKFTAQPSDDDDNVYQSTKGKESGTYYEFTINCDEDEHHIWFCYRKDSSGNKGADRGFIGVPKSVVSVLDVKQGSELSTEYKFGGVSAEGGKTYNINFNNVTVPNGSYIVPSYEDYTKTEKSINTEYVDLGLLSGLKWAKCNIGASSETDYGVFFQWGDISGISGSLVGKYSDEKYSPKTYKYIYDGSYTKYTTTDGITTLETVDDAASHIMGDEWRMPTLAEFAELCDGTTNEWTTLNGVSGRKFTSKTDTSKYIFIPAAGQSDHGSVYGVGDYGRVWSSSLYTSGPIHAYLLHFNSDNRGVRSDHRYYGCSVRGVRK